MKKYTKKKNGGLGIDKDKFEDLIIKLFGFKLKKGEK